MDDDPLQVFSSDENSLRDGSRGPVFGLRDNERGKKGLYDSISTSYVTVTQATMFYWTLLP